MSFLRTKQKYELPETVAVEQPGAKAFADDLVRIVSGILQNIYDDLKTMFIRLSRLQTEPHSPAQITSNQNDYDIGDAQLIRLSTDAARDVTGFEGGSGGRRLTLINVGSFTITLRHQNASSDAANRILAQTGADVALAANGIRELVYDSTTARWRT